MQITQLHYEPDFCKTADDVRRAAQEVARRQRMSRPGAVGRCDEQAMLTALRNVKAVQPPTATIIKLRPVKKKPQKPITEEAVLEAVCRVSNLNTQDLLGPSRTQTFTPYRWIAMALISHLMKKSSLKIGFYFNRDHATVLNALEKTKPLLDMVCAKLTPDATIEQYAVLAVACVKHINGRDSRRQIAFPDEFKKER